MLKDPRVKRIIKMLRELIYPEGFPCIGCWSEGRLYQRNLCAKCTKTLERNVRVCPVCGRSNYTGLCEDCRKGRQFSKAIAPYKYKGSAKGMVISLKYRDATHAADIMAQDIAAIWDDDIRVDVMTGVPSSQEAFIKRGYNQSYEIATRLSEIINVPFRELIGLKRSGKSQHFLTKEQRRQQYIDSFSCIGDVKNKRVLLVDDVLTTGATADACARVLIQSGALDVYVAVFASVPYNTAKYQKIAKKNSK